MSVDHQAPGSAPLRRPPHETLNVGKERSWALIPGIMAGSHQRDEHRFRQHPHQCISTITYGIRSRAPDYEYWRRDRLEILDTWGAYKAGINGGADDGTTLTESGCQAAIEVGGVAQTGDRIPCRLWE